MEDQVTTDLRFSIVPHWIIKRDISDRAIRLYAVLARFADAETAQAFPGRTRLSKELKCSLRSVDRAVVELEDIGAIRKRQRVKDGVYQSSLYTVVRIEPVSGVARPRDMDDATPCQDGHDPVSPVAHITRTTELEPLKLQPLNDISATEFDSKFDEWWSVYPNRKGKGAAKTAYKKALKKVSHELLLDSARRYRDDPNREQQFTPYPQKWLNEERWEDGPEPVRQQKLTNAEKAVQLALKYRAQAEQERLALESNEGIIDIEDEPAFNGGWLKGVDDV